MKDLACLQAAYRANGYCVIPNALSSRTLAGLQSAAEELLLEPPDDGGGKYHDIGRGEARRFLRHRHTDFPAVEQFLFGDDLRRLLGGLLATDEAYLFNEQFVVKGAGDGASFAWHQDGAYVGFDHQPYVTIWIALDDTTEDNGCVYVLPRNLDTDSALVPHNWDAAGKEKVGYDGADPGVPLTCTAGSIVAFSSTTLHRSGENRTPSRRRAYICQYAPERIVDPTTGKPKHFAKQLSLIAR